MSCIAAASSASGKVPLHQHNKNNQNHIPTLKTIARIHQGLPSKLPK